MLIIPTQPLPSQALQVQLDGQSCTIEIVQQRYMLATTLHVGSTLIIAGVVSQNLNRIVRSRYLGFVGDLVFGDTQGSDDPLYWGLGSRWLLAYLEEADLAARGF